MKPQRSSLVSRAGLACLAAAALVAAYLRITALEVLLVAVLLLCLVAYLWARGALRKISVEITDEDSRAFPGEVIEAGARLKNAKLLPVIWLKAVFSQDRNACVAPLDDEGRALTEPDSSGEMPEICEHFLWVMPQQSIAWRQRVMAVRRGVCRLEHVELFSGDGFGLAEQRAKAVLPAGFRFIVYPAVFPVGVSPIINNLSELERTPRGLYTDPTLINSIRDYRDGDSVRDINWRLLARQGSLQVNVREKLSMRRVCLIADLESFSYEEEIELSSEKRLERRVHAEELEHGLSLMASVIVALGERNVVCTLVVPGFGGSPARLEVPDDVHSQTQQLLTALAEIEYAGEPASLPAGEMVLACHRLGQFFLFSLDAGGCAPELESRLEGLPLFSIVARGGEDGADRHIINETELTAV